MLEILFFPVVLLWDLFIAFLLVMLVCCVYAVIIANVVKVIKWTSHQWKEYEEVLPETNPNSSPNPRYV